jgi:hypothetical protein
VRPERRRKTVDYRFRLFGDPHHARHNPRQPSCREHKGSGQAVVTIDGKDIYVERYGTKSSKAEYDRHIAEWLAGGRRLTAGDSALTVAEVIDRFWTWAEQHYRKPDGEQTSEIWQYRCTLQLLNHLYGTLPARDFGPLKVQAVRLLMVQAYTHPKYGEQTPCSRVLARARAAWSTSESTGSSSCSSGPSSKNWYRRRFITDRPPYAACSAADPRRGRRNRRTRFPRRWSMSSAPSSHGKWRRWLTCSS